MLRDPRKGGFNMVFARDEALDDWYAVSSDLVFKEQGDWVEVSVVRDTQDPQSGGPVP